MKITESVIFHAPWLSTRLIFSSSFKQAPWAGCSRTAVLNQRPSKRPHPALVGACHDWRECCQHIMNPDLGSWKHPQGTGQPHSTGPSPNISSAKDGSLGCRQTGQEEDGRKRVAVPAYSCPSGVSHRGNSPATSVSFAVDSPLLTGLPSWCYWSRISQPLQETQRDASLIPEQEMATYSSILTWEIPGTQEPGRLQSTGSQRVGHD